MRFDNARTSQTLISSIILLKTALDALPLLAKVKLPASWYTKLPLLLVNMFSGVPCFENVQVLKDAQSFLLSNVYKSVCENEKYPSMRKRYVTKLLLQIDHIYI